MNSVVKAAMKSRTGYNHKCGTRSRI